MARRPLFVPLIGWVAGVLAATSVPFAAIGGALLTAGGMAGWIASSARTATLASLFALSAGTGLLHTLSVSRPSDDLSRLLAKPAIAGNRMFHSPRDIEITVAGRVAEDPRDFPNRTLFVLDVEAASQGRRPIPAGGRIAVSVYAKRFDEIPPPPAPTEASSLKSPVSFGDRIRIRGELRLPARARNTGEFDYRAYLRRRGIHAVLTVYPRTGAVPVERLKEKPLSWTGLCFTAKHRMEGILRATLPPSDASLMAGLLFSEQTQLSDELREDFNASGAVHLLSTSGVHVAVLAAVVTLLLGRARHRYRKPVAAVMILLLVAFGMMAGMRPAVARAVWITSLAYGAVLTRRRADGANLLCFAALAWLVAHPFDLWDMGFQFSFLAASGLLLFLPRLEEWMRDVPPWRKRLNNRGSGNPPDRPELSPVIRCFAVSIAVSVALYPLLAYYTGRISLISPLSNLVVVPFTLPLIASGLLQAGVGLLSPMGAALIGYLTSGLLFLFVEAVRLFARMPGAVTVTGSPPISVLVVYYMLLFAPVIVRTAHPIVSGHDRDTDGDGDLRTGNSTRMVGGTGDRDARDSASSALTGGSRKMTMGRFRAASNRVCWLASSGFSRVALAACILLAALVAFRTFGGGPGNRTLRITAIDVGQGDCLLIRTPDGASMLLDGGGPNVYVGEKMAGTASEASRNEPPGRTVFDVGERVVVPYLQRLGIRRLDVVALTHPHDDHAGGLGAVLNHIAPRFVVWNGDRGDSPLFRRFLAEAHRRRITPRVLRAGDRIALGRETIFTVLHPAADEPNADPDGVNDRSMVLLLRFRGFTALFTGDIGRDTEQFLLSRLPHVDLLKIGHHGGAGSTSEELLARIRPRVAVAQAGERNRFGHPSPEVIRRLARGGTIVYRTDRDGEIDIETDGDRIAVNTFLPSHRRMQLTMHP